MGLSLVIPVQLFLNHVYLYFHVSIRRGGATATSNREPDRIQLENVFRVGRCRVGTQVIQCEHLDGRRISTCDEPTRREGGGDADKDRPLSGDDEPPDPTWANDRRLGPDATPRGAGHSTGIIASAPRGARAAILAN